MNVCHRSSYPLFFVLFSFGLFLFIVTFYYKETDNESRVILESDVTLDPDVLERRQRLKSIIESSIIKVGPIVDNSKNDKGCGHSFNRDYKTNPIKIHKQHFSEYGDERESDDRCDIGCVKTDNNGLSDVVKSKTQCPHSLNFVYSMENIQVSKNDQKTLTGSVDPQSDVPLTYYTWYEYDYMKEPVEKNASAMLAVFISNCGPKKRLNILKELASYGVSYHSYGRCEKNIETPPGGGRSGNYVASKAEIGSRYKFTFSAENSEANDYVTEKLFGTLQSGSVPVYFGAPNGKSFAPSQKSIIFVNDFKTIKDLAEYLIYLDKNDTAYQEYLEWKYVGLQESFIDLLDRVMDSSLCRLCIKAGDYHRKMYGNRVGNEERKISLEAGEIALKVRPREGFYFKYVYLKKNEFNLKTLYDKILDVYKNHEPPVGGIKGVGRVWDKKRRYIEDEELELRILEQDEELEVAFTYPIHPKRGKYYEWQMNKLKDE